MTTPVNNQPRKIPAQIVDESIQSQAQSQLQSEPDTAEKSSQMVLTDFLTSEFTSEGSAATKLAIVTKEGLKFVSSTSSESDTLETPTGRKTEVFQSTQSARDAITLGRYSELARSHLGHMAHSVVNAYGPFEATGTYRVTVDPNGKVTVSNTHLQMELTYNNDEHNSEALERLNNTILATLTNNTTWPICENESYSFDLPLYLNFN